ncbi:hypothetical protein [Shewanella oncorhynchi]|uniref:hypothetical protein n=1 Tax=Shewanella oncorhynchi TaxID=2726434 RepID=UPI003D7A6F4F
MTNINVPAKACGRFDLKINRANGSVEQYEFANNLLNNFFSNSVDLLVCFVGTDSSVSNTDTSLTSLGYTTSRALSSNYTVDSAGVVSFNYVNTYTFSAGAIIGNMSCIGLSSSAAISGTNLKVKSLIKDVNGDPTTITATASDQIIVTHTLNLKFNQHQNLGTFVVDGVTYQADFYDIYVANGSGVGATLWPIAPALYFQSGEPNMYPGIASGFTPPTVPTYISSQLVVDSGRRYNGAAADISRVFNATLGKMTTTYSFTMQANTNLASNNPIAVICGSNSDGGTLAHWAVQFTPPLPKTPSIAYVFSVSFSISRA